MTARGPWVGIALALAGCGEPLVDDQFTELEWSYLQTFHLEAEPSCPEPFVGPACDRAAALGQIVFFEREFSGPLQIASDLGEVGEEGRVACASCHVPDAWFVDDRSNGGTSLGAGWTRRNAPSIVNAAFQTTFTWDQRFDALADVLEAPLNGASLMRSSPERLRDVVCTKWWDEFRIVFDGSHCGDPAQLTADVAILLEAYERRLVSGDAPFDRYLDGEHDAISASAKRGAKLFIGEAHCADCHSGPLLSDGQLHVTGVAQHGDTVPEIDVGGPWPDGGQGFRTPSLRQVAETAPYLHTGAVPSLAEVVETYRWGGEAAGFVGDKDALMFPLDLTDQDVADLVAFMETLTGAPVDPALLEDLTR